MDDRAIDGDVMVAECDASERFVAISAACARRLRRRPADVIGRSVREVLGDGTYGRMVPFIRQALNGDEMVADLDLSCADWAFGDIRTTYLPRLGPDGRPTGFIVGLVAVTARSGQEPAATRALAKADGARRAAEESNRVREEFLAAFSHELRTPVSAVIGWSRVLRSPKSDAGLKERAMEAIERNAKAAATLVEDLLDVSRIANGVIRIAREPVNVAQLLHRAVEVATPAAEMKHVTITTVPVDAALWIPGDTMRLQQVLTNILGNAVRHTPPGGTVSLDVVRRAQEVALRITDTGQGIAPADLALIFDRFHQVKPSDGRRHEGLGLGLTIARQLIELHGGQIRAESDGVGRGATFTVTLPADTVDEVEPAPTRSSLALAALDSAGVTIAGVRILYIADDSDTTEFVCAALRSSGALITRTTADEARDVTAAQSFDVLLCDVDTTADTFDRIAALRRDMGTLANMPAVALTSYGRVNDRTRALAAGFHMSVRKPIESAELIAGLAGLARLNARDRRV